MKTFISKYQNVINILIPIVIIAFLLFTTNLEQRISEIDRAYMIDTITLNNSFITLNVAASTQNNESFQKTKSDIDEQIKKFNYKYENLEKEREMKNNKKLWVDRVIYTLTFLLVIFNTTLITKKYSPDLLLKNYQ